MKKQILYAIILLCIICNQVSLQAAKKSIHGYLNEEAQRIVNNFYIEAKFDAMNAVNVCSFLNECSRFAAFPVNTCITVRNRKYIKTKNTIYGNWCILLPQNTDEQKATKEILFLKSILNKKKNLNKHSLDVAKQQLAFSIDVKKNQS